MLSRYQDTSYPGTDTTCQAGEKAGKIRDSGWGAEFSRESKGRGADWTDERGTSEEGRRRLEGGPEASGWAE
jgi:hypothetical protein